MNKHDKDFPLPCLTTEGQQVTHVSVFLLALAVAEPVTIRAAPLS